MLSMFSYAQTCHWLFSHLSYFCLKMVRYWGRNVPQLTCHPHENFSETWWLFLCQLLKEWSSKVKWTHHVVFLLVAITHFRPFWQSQTLARMRGGFTWLRYTCSKLLPLVQKLKEVRQCLFTGLDCWTGLLDWTIGLDYWTHPKWGKIPFPAFFSVGEKLIMFIQPTSWLNLLP